MLMFDSRRCCSGIPGLLILATAGAPALAQQADKTTTPATDSVLEEIVVFAEGSRLPADVSAVPGSITLVSQETLQQQATINSDLGRILSSAVPGMSLSNNDGNNFAQTLRGRKPAFFIDGVPQSAELRGGGRDMRILHPNVLERVEVINGATSIYGLGGAGGVINYITRRPVRSGMEIYSEVGLSSALSTSSSDSLEYSFAQGLSARGERADIVANVTWQDRGLFFDGDGDPIPPDPTGQTGIADMTELSLFAKVGVDFSDNVRWEVTGMHYDSEVDTDYTVAQGSFVNGVKSVAEPKRQNNIVLFGGAVMFDFIGAEDPSSDNTFGSTSLIFKDVFGSTVKTQLFYKQSEYTWRHLDFFPSAPTLGGFPPDGSQLLTENSKAGGRVDVLTPLELGGVTGNVIWGVDYTRDETRERLVDGRIRTSTLAQDSRSLFAQFQLDLTDRLHLRTGARFDDFKLDIPSFQAIDYFSTTVLHDIVGTELDYDNVSGNFGLVFDITDELNVFGSWSQGFSVGNVIRTIGGLRPTVPSPPTTYSIADLGLYVEPVTVDSYEAGLRFTSGAISASLTGFYSESDLGATFDPITLQTLRAPERIWGGELVVSASLSERFRGGLAYSRLDGEMDADNNGSFERPLDFSRVPPPILTAHVEYDFTHNWRARLQSTTLFSEERFRPPFGQLQRDVQGYTIVDLLISGPLFGGKLSVGVENLLNKQYYPFATYMNCADNVLFDSFCATTAPGARGTVRFSINY